MIGFLSACCKPGLDSAFHAVVLAVIGLVASAALISFDAAFVARPSVCILTPSCVDNSISNSTFSYGFQQSFLTVFTGWAPFKNYGQSQVKFLCQTIQIGVGALAFILYIIYIIIYYSCWSKSKQQIQPDPSSSLSPSSSQPRYPAVNPPYYSPPQHPGQPGYYPPPPPGQPGYYPRPPPGQPGYYPRPPPGQPSYYPPPVPQNPYPRPSPPIPQSYYPVPSPPPVVQSYPPPPPPPAHQGYYPPPPPRQYSPPGQPYVAWRPPVYGQQPAPGTNPWN